MSLTFSRIQGNVVHVRVSGTLSDGDYQESFVPKMEELFETWTGLRMLFVMDPDFEGWDAHSAWDELRFEHKHRHEMVRVGVVGDQRWERWATKLSKLFTGANVRFFAPESEGDAREWVASGV